MTRVCSLRPPAIVSALIGTSSNRLIEYLCPYVSTWNVCCRDDANSLGLSDDEQPWEMS